MTPHGSRGAAGSRGPSTECGSDPELRADNRQPCPWETGTAVGWLGQEARPRGASWCLDHPWFLLWVPATAREDPSEGQAPGGLGPTLAGCAQGCSRPLVARFPICKLKRRAGGGPRPSALSPRSVPSTGHRPSGAGAPQAKVSPISHREIPRAGCRRPAVSSPARISRLSPGRRSLGLRVGVSWCGHTLFGVSVFAFPSCQ